MIPSKRFSARYDAHGHSRARIVAGFGLALALAMAGGARGQTDSDRPEPGSGSESPWRVYDFRDAFAIGRVDAPEAADGTADAASEEGAPRRNHAMTEAIAEIVRERFAGAQSVEVVSPHRLLVLGSPETYERIDEFFELQRRSRGAIFVIDSAFARADADVYEAALGREDTGILENAEAPDRLAFLRDGSWDVLTSPRVNVRNAMHMSISIGDRIPYVRAWEEREVRLPEPRTYEVPVIETIEDGVVLGGRVIRVDERAMDVDLALRFTELTRPVPVERTPYGPIAVPEIRRSEVEARMTLVPGATAYFSVREDDGKRLVLFVQVRMLDLSEDGDLARPLDSIERR